MPSRHEETGWYYKELSTRTGEVPQGGEKQLIKAITGKKFHPADYP
jgi:hypothetical protein